jgi:hypothetical protein
MANRSGFVRGGGASSDGGLGGEGDQLVAASTDSAPVASNATSSLVSTTSVITGGASNAPVTNQYGVVWSNTGWTINLPGAPIPFDGEREMVKAASLFAVAGLPLPKKATLEKFKFSTTFNGDEKSYHAASEQFMATVRSHNLEFYIEQPIHKALERALGLINMAHLLPNDVGGAIDPMAALSAVTAPAVVTFTLCRYINGVVDHVKYIYSVVYNALLEALVEEKHVTKTLQTLQQQLPTQYADATPISVHLAQAALAPNDDKPGSNADPHALWVMLRTQYQPNHKRHVTQLLDVVDATSCGGDTRHDVRTFFTTLRSLQQELESIQGITLFDKKVNAALVGRRRRNGLTPLLKLELQKDERKSARDYTDAELEKWAQDIADIHEERNMGAVSVSAVQTNPGKKAPSNANAKHCDYCHQRGNTKTENRHDTAHHFGLPTGWKKGDPIVARNEDGQRSARSNPSPSYNQLISMVAALQVEVNSSKTSSSSYSSAHLPATRKWNGYVASLTEEVKYDMPVYEMKVACVSAPDVSSMNGDGVDLNIDRKALLDSGSAPMLAPNSKLAKGAVKKMDFVTKLTMADRSASMYATECMTMTLGKDLYIENVLIVPAMKNIIISETKLREQMLSAICLNGWANKQIVRVLNGKEAAAGEKPRYEGKALATFKKTGAPGEAGLYWLTIDEADIKHNNEAKNLSNGSIFNIAYGDRAVQEEEITIKRKKQAAIRTAREAANPPDVPGRFKKKVRPLTEEQKKAAALAEIKAKRAASSLSSSSPSVAASSSSSSAVTEDSEDDMYDESEDEIEEE